MRSSVPGQWGLRRSITISADSSENNYQLIWGTIIGGRIHCVIKLNLDINPCSCSPKSVGRSISWWIKQVVPFVWLSPPSGRNIANAFVRVVEKYVAPLGTPFQYMRWKEHFQKVPIFQWIDLSGISEEYINPTIDVSQCRILTYVW